MIAIVWVGVGALIGAMLGVLLGAISGVSVASMKWGSADEGEVVR